MLLLLFITYISILIFFYIGTINFKSLSSSTSKKIDISVIIAVRNGEHSIKNLIDDLDGEVDMVVMGVGTGGTITGVAKKLKQYNSNIKIIGVDPFGSILGGGTEVHSYKVEGIGYDFFPNVLDNN